MANKDKKNNLKIILLVVIAIVVFFFLFLIKSKSTQEVTIHTNPSIIPSAATLKTYHSKFLDITITIPSDFSVKERLPEVLLEKYNGIIIINKIGTNRAYKSIKEFLDESYKSDNLPKEINRQQIKINGIDCELSIEKYLNRPELNNKAYYCFINSNIFLSFSTTSPELYSDLGQIAQSFRYAP